MNHLRKLHLYLGCVFTPLIIFFAVTGAWQIFGKHRSLKDGSYHAPAILQTLSAVHMDQGVKGATTVAAMQWLCLAMALGLVVSSLIGVLMAFQVVRYRRTVWMCLLGGAGLPLLLVLAGSWGR